MEHEPVLTKEQFVPVGKRLENSNAISRPTTTYLQDAWRRLRQNKVALTAIIILVLVLLMALLVPVFSSYSMSSQDGSAVNKGPTLAHIFGTDSLGRDLSVRCWEGARVSLFIAFVATFVNLIIGVFYGGISGYAGGRVDLFMMRIVDIIYTVPDLLIIILLASTLKYPLQSLAEKPGFGWINIIGVPLISILIVFALLYWVGMARIVRSQVLTLKESEYVTAARALGAGTGRIIKKHILTNCIGTLIVTTTLQIPSAIFTESFLSFLGIGVSAPMPSLGSLASTAIDGLQSYPYRLFAPAIAISVVILSFNLFGDGLRDAFDPKLKN